MRGKPRAAVLFSGGKDSVLALHLASRRFHIACLVTIISENPASYMYHTPNIGLARVQAEAMGLPIIMLKTKGEKEKELAELERGISRAMERYKIKAVISGAIASVYQKSRIERICEGLNLNSITPLWQKDQFWVLEELLCRKFRVKIIGVFGEGLEGFLGREIDFGFIQEMREAVARFSINPAGEGGEFESLVLDAPMFRKSLTIVKSHVEQESEFCQRLLIEKIQLQAKALNRKPHR